MLENKFKQGLTKELKERFPGCVVVHLDPNEVQGHPDLWFCMVPPGQHSKASAQQMHLIVRIRIIMSVR